MWVPRTSARARPAGPHTHAPAILQPQPDTELSAPPRAEIKACLGLELGCAASSVSCAQPSSGCSVHRQPLHLPPMQPISSKGLCPHWCPDAQCTPMSPIVRHLLTAYDPECGLLFTQQLQASSSLAISASFSAVRDPSHSLSDEVETSSKFVLPLNPKVPYKISLHIIVTLNKGYYFWF